MANKKLPIIKADANAKPGITQEEKELQVKRFFAQKRESYFQMILANSIQAGTHPKQAVDLALEVADYALEKLFPIPTEEKKEGE